MSTLTKPAAEGAPVAAPADARQSAAPHPNGAVGERVVEVGGREGPEPTRFGDWEKAGRCIDF